MNVGSRPGVLLFLALNLTHTYASKVKIQNIVIAVIIQKQNHEDRLIVALG